MKNKVKKQKETTNNEKYFDIALLITFILMLIFVIYLFVKAITLKNKVKDNIDFTLPLLEEKFNNEFLVDIEDYIDDSINDYKFKICNYNSEKKNKKDVIYDLKITNNTGNSTIKLYKDNKNLLVKNEKEEIIEKEKLSKDKNMCNTYVLIINAKNIEKKENIQITVRSIDNN